MWEKADGSERRTNSQRQQGSSEEQLRKDVAMLEGNPDSGEEVIAFVGKGVEFKGVIKYNGTVRISGRMEGEIHTDGVLLVEDGAVIVAQISASKVVSRGQITGDIVAVEKVNLLSPAILNGSVKAPLLSMEEGVLFSGTLEMPEGRRGEIRRTGADEMVTPLRPGAPLKTVAG
ncbi:MAG: polymer-forming cytoskeletal protein [Nitrospira sp.]|nr:polymer-forming cytoskeletal protein [Nitrospira sp.]